MTVLADPPDSTAESTDPPQPAPRPLALAGLLAAVWSAGIGVATLTTITLVGWVAAPRAAIGPGLPGVFRAAVQLWLVAHHTGFDLPNGRVGLLPLGLLLLPGALLFRAGGWITRAAEVPGLRRVGVTHAALSLAVPYSILLGALALAAGTDKLRPSVWEAAILGFLLALVAGGLGSARALVTAAGGRMSWSGLLRLLPERPRALVVGVTGATLIMVAAGAALVGGSLVAHATQAQRLQDALAPGLIGGALLFLLQLVFLPNAVIWGMSYAVGPGFAVGAGTSVSPSGVALGELPVFPLLAALPDPGPAPTISLVALAAPFVAGVVGGVLTVRTIPGLVLESAALWGFACGVLTGVVMAALALLSSGPLGGERLAAVGPSAWQVGLMAALEVGIAAAIAAWATNWLTLRRGPAVPMEDVDDGPPEPPAIPDHMEFVAPDPVLADEPAMVRKRSREAVRTGRAPARRRPRRGDADPASDDGAASDGAASDESAVDEGTASDADAGRGAEAAVGPDARRDAGREDGVGDDGDVGPARGRGSGPGGEADLARAGERDEQRGKRRVDPAGRDGSGGSGGVAAEAGDPPAAGSEETGAPSGSRGAARTRGKPGTGGKVETRGGAIFVLKDDAD